jgi:arylsulfatase A-like enzyme
MTQKNVLIFVTDQQRADHVGYAGNTTVQTPNVDALAARSTIFRNAWVSNPVCMPNRSTMITGRMPSAHGCIFNDRSLNWHSNTFIRSFKQAGYATGLIGKSHLQHGISKNSQVPYRGQPSEGEANAAGWDSVEDFERYLEGTPKDPDDFYGFSHIELSIDHGASVAGHHLRWALDRGGKLEDLVIDQDKLTNGSDRSQHWDQIYRPPYTEELHSTEFVTDRTINFINEANQKAEPWLAWCSFPDPHHPLTPPGKWFDMYNPSDMTLPASRTDSLEDAPAHLKLFQSIHPKDQRNWVAPCGYGNDDLLSEAIAATYGMISFIDDGIGRILNHLEALGVREDTIIAFTSDHGDMMGDHGLFVKGFMHYRGTLQVPLLIDHPDFSAADTNRLASSIDLAPTFLDLCGMKHFDGIQGVSLKPLLENPDVELRGSVLIEDDVSVTTSKLTPIPARTRTLVTEQYRYTRNSKGEEQLFDLVSDPDEMNNIKDQRELKLDMLEKLNHQMMMADDSSRGAPATEAIS